MIPTKRIPHVVQELTNIKYEGGVLKSNDIPVKAVSQQEGISQFLAFVCGIDKPILIGHNIKRFDLPKLYHRFSTSQNQMFNTNVCAFLDTLLLFKDVYPELEAYNQSYLVKTLLAEEYNAHNALGDVQALQKLVHKCTTRDQCKGYMFTPGDITNQNNHNDIVARNKATMSHLTGKGKALSDYMAQSIAASGMKLCRIVLALKRGGVDGLTKILQEKTLSGEPRVTKRGSPVAKKLANALQIE